MDLVDFLYLIRIFEGLRLVGTLGRNAVEQKVESCG